MVSFPVAVDLIVTHIRSVFDPSIRHQSIKYGRTEKGERKSKGRVSLGSVEVVVAAKQPNGVAQHNGLVNKPNGVREKSVLNGLSHETSESTSWLMEAEQDQDSQDSHHHTANGTSKTTVVANGSTTNGVLVASR